jgi:hypothetical protein
LSVYCNIVIRIHHGRSSSKHSAHQVGTEVRLSLHYNCTSW